MVRLLLGEVGDLVDESHGGHEVTGRECPTQRQRSTRWARLGLCWVSREPEEGCQRANCLRLHQSTLLFFLCS